MTKLAIATVIASLLLGACEHKAVSTATPAGSSTPVAATTPKLATPPPIPRERAVGTLAAWMDAQNRNSFGEYQKLYGEPFVGIKRTGEVEKEYQLRGWLEDRWQLFQRNPLVTVENVKVITTATTAIVEFDQTWKTSRFQDFGRKRLVLKRDPNDGHLRIGREEMLTSTTSAVKVARPALPEGAHYFIKKTAGGFGAVLGLLATAKATGPYKKIEWGLAERAVKLDTAKQAGDMIGQEVDVYALDAQPCLTKIVGIVAVAEAYGGVDPNDPDGPRQTWELAGDTGIFLIADLRPVNGACADPLWGRLSSLPKPTAYETRKASPEELQRAILALNHTAQGREAQRMYLAAKQKAAADNPDQPLDSKYTPLNWYQSKPEATATVMTNPKSKESYVNIEIYTTDGPCDGGFYALATFKITDQNLIEITPQWPETAARDLGYTLYGFLPETGAQLPENAQPVFFSGCLLYANNGTGWVPAKHDSGPRLICGC
ncbi:MAG TPA: hypothetical protein VL137_07910 [Polyangiaceae bacterium]|nr:hypothetical protein [Polyangiaceae bacterium]